MLQILNSNLKDSGSGPPSLCYVASQCYCFDHPSPLPAELALPSLWPLPSLPCDGASHRGAEAWSHPLAEPPGSPLLAPFCHLLDEQPSPCRIVPGDGLQEPPRRRDMVSSTFEPPGSPLPAPSATLVTSNQPDAEEWSHLLSRPPGSPLLAPLCHLRDEQLSQCRAVLGDGCNSVVAEHPAAN